MAILYLDNGTMSLIIQIASMCLIAFFSLSHLDAFKAFKFGFYVMAAAAVTGQLFIAGGGISFLLSIILFPVAGGAAGFVLSASCKYFKRQKLKHEI
jgi:hypothetical protein